MSFHEFQDNSSSCAIDALGVLSKRIEGGFNLTEEYPDEIELLVQSIVEGEVSRSDLERVTSLSVLWNAVVRIARSLGLGAVFTSPDQDYSSLPVHVSRFIGAFLSTFEVVLEMNSGSLQELLSVLFEVFSESDQSQQDMIVQLMKDYKDWFPYSYMFNRKSGKFPKSSFDQINNYFKSQKKIMNRSDSTKSIGSEEETYKDEEDDDTLGDSFAHESFPDILTPNIMPLKPFSESNNNQSSNNNSRDYQYAVQKTVSQEEREFEEERKQMHNMQNDNAVSSNQEYILKSYYDYSSNWNQQTVEEDEDSDRDSNYYVPKPAPKRMTRMKSSKRKEKVRKNRKKASSIDSLPSPESTTTTMTMMQSQSDPNASDRGHAKLSTTGKTVSFSNHNPTLSYEQDHSNLDDEVEEISAAVKTTLYPKKSNQNDDNDDDAVEEFEAILDASPQKERTNSKKGVFDSDSSFTIPAAASSVTNLPSRYSLPIKISSATMELESDGESKMRSAVKHDSDESSIDLSDSERHKPNKQQKDQNPPNPTAASSSSTWAHEKAAGRKAPSDNDRKIDVSSSATLLPKFHSVSSDDEEEVREKTETRPNHRKTTKPSFSVEQGPRVGDVVPPRRLNELSPERIARDGLPSSKNRQRGSSDNDREGDDASYFRFRNPLDSSLEVNKLNQRPHSSNPLRDPAESWKTSSSSYSNFQEILNNDYDDTYRVRESTTSSSSAPFTSIPAVRISHSQPRSDKTLLRRSYEFQPPDNESEARHETKGSIVAPTSKKTSRETIDKVKEKLKELRKKRELSTKSEPQPSLVTASGENEEVDEDNEENTVKVIPVNRNLLSADAIREKATLFHYQSHNSVTVSDKENSSLSIHMPDSETAMQGMNNSPLLPVTTPILKRINSFDLKPLPSNFLSSSEDLNRGSLMMPTMSSSTNDGEYLVERLQQIKQNQQLELEQYQSSEQLQQSLTIVNLSQSMNDQTYYQQPFQELPINLTLPPQSEFAMETGIIFEGFLSKKSSSFLGQWQKRFFVLKESPINFCELNIYYSAVESLWGMIPLQMKCSIPIFDISSVETHGKVTAQGKEFIIRFATKANQKSRFSISSFFRSSKSKEEPANPPSDSDNASDAGSVASESQYGGKIKQIMLQADDAETRLLWVTMLNKALKAAQLETME